MKFCLTDLQVVSRVALCVTGIGLTIASAGSAAVLYSFNTPAFPNLGVGPISVEYISPELVTLQDASNPPDFGNIASSRLAFTSADFPITSIYLNPGGVESSFLTVDPQVIVQFDNPGVGQISALNVDFGVPNYFDHFGTYTVTSGPVAGATLTIEAVPEPASASTIAVALGLCAMLYRRFLRITAAY